MTRSSKEIQILAVIRKENPENEEKTNNAEKLLTENDEFPHTNPLSIPQI